MDKGLDILYRYRPASMDILNHFCIQLGRNRNAHCEYHYSKLRKYFSKDYIRINLTFFTKCIRISNKSWKTDTYGSMILCLTFGILATWMGITWILTLFLYTCKVVRTFRINNTFRFWCWNNMRLHRNHAIETEYIYCAIDWMLKKNSKIATYVVCSRYEVTQ